MKMKKLLVIPSLAVLSFICSSSTVNNSKTFVYITYDAGEGSFDEEGKVKTQTFQVAYGRTWHNRFSSEKPSTNPIKASTSPTESYDFVEYTIDDKSISDSYQFKENTIVTAKYKLHIDEHIEPYPAGTFSSDSYSWESLSSIADRGLTELKRLFKADIDKNTSYPGTFIGLTRNVKFNDDTVYQVRVIGEDHDILADNTGVAPLTFEFVNLIQGVPYDTYANNSNCWETSSLRRYLNGVEFKSSFDYKLANNIKKVKKTTNAGKRALSENTANTEDSLFILSLKEYGIETYPYHNAINVDEEGTTYKYYESVEDTKRIKKINGSNEIYWARSPETISYNFAWPINATGGAGVVDPDYTKVLTNEKSPIETREAHTCAPCFALGRTSQNRLEIQTNNKSIVSSKNPGTIDYNTKFETKLSLNEKQYPSISHHCKMFDLTNISTDNLMIAVGIDNSYRDITKPFKNFIQLSKVDELKSETGYVGYTIDNDYNLVVSSAQDIYDYVLGQKDVEESSKLNPKIISGIYIIANAEISDDWSTIYNNAKYNKQSLKDYYVPGITKKTTDNNYNARIIGINSDMACSSTSVTSLRYYAGLTFEFTSAYNKQVKYGDNNDWESSNLKTTLNSSEFMSEIKNITIGSGNSFTRVIKSTVCGGSATSVNTGDYIFALSPTEMGITQEYYNNQYYHFLNNQTAVINEEGKTYDYYSNSSRSYSMYLNNMLRYHPSRNENDKESIWLRSSSSVDKKNSFVIANNKAANLEESYYGQCILNQAADTSVYVCPCFAI